jgi:hypothetical protein
MLQPSFGSMINSSHQERFPLKLIQAKCESKIWFEPMKSHSPKGEVCLNEKVAPSRPFKVGFQFGTWDF